MRWHWFPARPGKRCRHLSQYLTELVRRKAIAPGGDVVADRVTKTSGGGNVAAYITKDCWRREVMENVILSTEFHFKEAEAKKRPHPATLRRTVSGVD